MRCEEFEIRLQRRLDLRDDLLVDQDLCSHAAVCQSCDEQLEIHRALNDASREFASREFAPEPSFGFSQRVVDEFTSNRRTRNWGMGIGLGVCGTIAASILIVIFVRGDEAHSTPEGPDSEPAVARKLEPQPANAAAFLPQIGQLAGFVQEIDASRIVGSNPPISTRPLKPIATGFQTTIDALKRTMPGGRSDSDEEPQAQRRVIRAMQMA